MEQSKNTKNEGMTVEQCMQKAEALIEQNGACLLVMDIISSREHYGDQSFYDEFFKFINELNDMFDEYLPENNLTSISRYEKGFRAILGDGVTGAISNSGIIPNILNYAKTNYPDISLRYSVAADGYDEAVDIIK